jgi:phospholipid/cholesterol/gamma-HCH transport system ATP-binding protein
MIRFIDIHKRFGDRKVLDGVSLDVAEGQVLYIVGTSGAGKSVLVKQLIGLIRPDAGRILLGGVDVTWLSEEALAPVRKKCAMVFQHATLLDAMSVVDNVALPIRKHLRLRPAEARAMALDKLDRVGMRHAADQLPGELGDGLKKRVAIARALTLDPAYVIFDEPTTALDPIAAAQVDDLIRNLRQEAGVTAVVVSHDLRSIFSVADRVAMLYEGKVRFDGPPSAIRTSEDPVVRQFFAGDPDGPMVTT